MHVGFLYSYCSLTCLRLFQNLNSSAARPLRSHQCRTLIKIQTVGTSPLLKQQPPRFPSGASACKTDPSALWSSLSQILLLAILVCSPSRTPSAASYRLRLQLLKNPLYCPPFPKTQQAESRTRPGRLRVSSEPRRRTPKVGKNIAGGS